MGALRFCVTPAIWWSQMGAGMTPCNPVNGYQRRNLLPPTTSDSAVCKGAPLPHTGLCLHMHPSWTTGVQVTAVFVTFVHEQRTIQKQMKIMVYPAYCKPLMARRTRRHAVSKEFSPRHHHHHQTAQGRVTAFTDVPPQLLNWKEKRFDVTICLSTVMQHQNFGFSGERHTVVLGVTTRLGK
jgi:hypothetical protein